MGAGNGLFGRRLWASVANASEDVGRPCCRFAELTRPRLDQNHLFLSRTQISKLRQGPGSRAGSGSLAPPAAAGLEGTLAGRSPGSTKLSLG